MRLKENEKFKLILGLGNKDAKSAVSMALLYAKAGVRFFDFAPEIYSDFLTALKKNGFNRDEFTLCVSIASLGDIHGRKAKISDIVCSGCGLCNKKCPQNAIFLNKKTKKYEIEAKKCIGCAHCKKDINCYAISFEYANFEINTLKQMINSGSIPDMVEFHASIPDKKQILSDFRDILSIFKGDISICINRKLFPLDEMVNLLLELKNIYRAANFDGEFLIQADGASMNGGAADKDSTLDCILFAGELLEFAKSFGIRLILSGGTNINTPDMVLNYFQDETDFPIIAYGTYARKIVSNLPYNKALLEAQNLFNNTVNYGKNKK